MNVNTHSAELETEAQCLRTSGHKKNGLLIFEIGLDLFFGV